jgi:hypothetical protein
MKLVEIVLEGKGGLGRMMEWVNLIRYIASTYVNVTMKPLLPLIYANKNVKTKRKMAWRKNMNKSLKTYKKQSTK